MNYLDWMVVVLYVVVIIGIAFVIMRSQKDLQDYYLGGRKIKWWQSGASTMATQLGAISFVSAPAFVAIKENGGLKWLCYEFGVPLALILVMAIIIPVLHRHHYVSIYEYLEKRFDSDTRSIVSFFFQLGRGLATAVTVLAGGLILSTALNISTTTAILIIGVVTIFYDVLGGIRVVILSDFLQMVIIIAGILICGVSALIIVGWDVAWSEFSPERLVILDFKNWGFSEEGTYAFWPMLFGGFFLYASYYGTDQSQVQRELTVGNVNDVRRSLMVNAIGRFPLVLLYCIMGVFIGAVISQPESMQVIGSALTISPEKVKMILHNNPDRMVPMFIVSYLPHGVIGFIFVAIMAAMMSSLDSGLNSLSAVTMRDIYQKYVKTEANSSHYLRVSKILTLLWGIFCVVAALVFINFSEAARHTTIVLINAVGSVLYGPILATFLLGMLSKRIGARSIKISFFVGIVLNIILCIFTSISWLWWNLTGFLSVCLFALLLSSFDYYKQSKEISELIYLGDDEPTKLKWRRNYYLVGVYFILILLVVIFVERIGL